MDKQEEPNEKPKDEPRDGFLPPPWQWKETDWGDPADPDSPIRRWRRRSLA